MSKTLGQLAASSRQTCLLARCTLSPKSSISIGRTRRRAASAAATGHEADPAASADAGATLRPRPALRVPASEENTGQGGPLLDDASALDSNWTHVQINNELATAQSLDDLFRVIQSGHHRFNKVNAVTALHRIARHSAALSRKQRLALRDHELVQIVCYQVVQCRGEWAGLTTSNVAYASAVLGFEPDYLLAKAVARLPAVLQHVGLTEIGLVLWACVKSDYNPPGFLKMLAPLITHLVVAERSIDERTLCRIPWAYARFDEYNAVLFRRFAAVAINSMSTRKMWSPQALSLMLWAYAKAIPPAAESSELLEVVSDQVVAQPDKFSWRDLANIAWSASRITLCQSRAGLVEFLFAPEEYQAPPVTPKTMQLFQRISALVQKRTQPDVHISHSQITSAAIIMKSFAMLSIGDMELFDSIIDRVVQLLDTIPSQAATTFIWTCARAGHQHTALFDGLAVHFVKQLQQGVPRSPSNIASVIYSYAYLNNVQSEPCRKLLAMLANTAEARADEFHANAIAATLWGLTVAQQLPQTSLARLWERAAQVRDDFTELELIQLAQVQSSAQLAGMMPPNGTDANGDGPSATAELQELADKSWAALMARGPRKVSALQQDVMAECRYLRLPFVMEYAAQHFSLDIAWPEQHFGIEVDGPRHFTANTLQPLGPTLLKQRQLAAAGWCLVSVPFHEWTRLRGRDAKQAYLAANLEASGRSIAELRAAYTAQLRATAQLGLEHQRRAIAAGRPRRPHGRVGSLQPRPAQEQPVDGAQAPSDIRQHEAADGNASGATSSAAGEPSSVQATASPVAGSVVAADPPGMGPGQVPLQR